MKDERTAKRNAVKAAGALEIQLLMAESATPEYSTSVFWIWLINSPDLCAEEAARPLDGGKYSEINSKKGSIWFWYTWGRNSSRFWMPVRAKQHKNQRKRPSVKYKSKRTATDQKLFLAEEKRLIQFTAGWSRKARNKPAKNGQNSWMVNFRPK